MAFEQFRSPSLPLSPPEYDQGYFNTLVNSITSFFTIIDSKAAINTDKVITNTLQLPIGAVTLANGANNNVASPGRSFIRITGPTGVFNITGFTAPIKSPVTNPDGTVLVVYNATSQNMTITNDSSSSTAANRILTNTGSDVATTGTGVIICIYSVTDSRWIMISSLT